MPFLTRRPVAKCYACSHGHMQRRNFITLLGGAAATWTLTARAQQPAMPVIGFLNSGSPDTFAPTVRAFLQGLKEAGYVDGQNVSHRISLGERAIRSSDRIGRRPCSAPSPVIAATSTPANLVAKAATTTISYGDCTLTTSSRFLRRAS